jgi:hypothetical protein
MNKIKWQVCCSAVALAVAASLAVAQPPRDEVRPHFVRPAAPHPGFHYDMRYGHAHFYPPRGYVVGALPVGFIAVGGPRARFFFAGGVWYAARGPGFVVVAPPVGLFVPVLPVAFTQVYIGGVPYYYANDTFYQAAPQGGYEVVAPPPGAQDAPPDEDQQPPADPGYAGQPADPSYAAPPPAGGPPPAPAGAYPPAQTPLAGGLFAYPANGQSEQQQSQDKWECHQWAVGQTGYDPTAPGGNPAGRPAYLHALSACLQGRGYSVR